jgi:AraC family transcriptional regulator
MVARVFFPAGTYRHPPTGLVQLRVVRRGSSYADIDLGLGLGARRVFTRPGDLLLSLPNRPTMFRIDEGRELTLLQVRPALATDLLLRCGGYALDDLTPLLWRPMREPLVAEILRRLEDNQPETDEAGRWAVGLVFAHLLGAARRIAATTTPPVLRSDALSLLLERIEATLTEAWPVERMAEEVRLPRRVFAAGFKDAKGMTAHQYLLRMRADHAEMLLHTTDLPFADVAVHSGFANQAHMTRVLNRLKRRTPGQIRSAG